MQISDLVPELQPMTMNVSVQLRYVCFFVLTVSIVARVARGAHSIGAMMRPIATAAILSGLIATLPDWFNLIRDEFWNMAMSIREEFASGVAPSGTALMQLIQPPDDGINWLEVTESVAKAVQYALGWFVVCIGGMIQLPMMLVQFIMECLCYMFLPIALAMLALDSTRGLGVRYLQQTLAILAWPIGFAVVDLVGYSLLAGPVSAGSAVALGIGTATRFTPASQLVGCIVALWLIIGSLGTPVVMQMLFCSGTPMSSAIGQAIQMGLGAAGLARLAGGAAASAAGSTSGASAASTTAGSGGGGSLPNPSVPPPSTPSGPLALGGGGRPAGLLTSGTSGAAATPPSPPLLPAGTNGIVQTPRGSLLIGGAADRMSPAQAQAAANQSGLPLTQAFSNGSIATYAPTTSRPARPAGTAPTVAPAPASPSSDPTGAQTAQSVFTSNLLPTAIAY